MTVQDLKENRDRIIKAVKNQNADLKWTMEKLVTMVEWPDYINEKPLMKNIDKMTAKAIDLFFKNGYNRSYTKDQMDEFNEKRRLENLPSSCR